jgi:hypothetical protein
LAGATLLPPATAGADAGPWTIASPADIAAASVNGGPWALNQAAAPAHSATLGSPNAGMCANGSLSQHTGTDLMQPYYFPLTFGTDKFMTGLFDYRVKDKEELLASANSFDGGKTWTVKGTAYQLNDGKCGTTATVTDNGEGHAAVVAVNDALHVYTLDRAATPSFLLEHTLHPAGGNLLASQPATEPVSGNTVPGSARLATGLIAPDGILGAIPGYHRPGAARGEVEVLYLSKLKGYWPTNDPHACPTDDASKTTLAHLGKTPNQDKPEMHLAHTSDGVAFTDDGAISIQGIDNTDPRMTYDGTRFIGPRGTLVQYIDGTYGLFFSGGNCGDGDSDAYHYVGYARSPDAVHWVVDNGMSNPLVSVDYANMGTTDIQRHHYTGRVYSPTVTFSLDGSSATLIFSGYNTPQPLPATTKSFGVPVANYSPASTQTADYRALMVTTIRRTGAPRPCPLGLAGPCSSAHAPGAMHG